MIVDQVYLEASRCPWDPARHVILDQMIERLGIIRMSFPSDLSSEVVDEYFRLKAENPRLGKGERACMSMARYYRDILVSSNFRDIVPYCERYSIDYLGFFDILWIAVHKALISESEANRIIDYACRMDNARFPAYNIGQYCPNQDLSSWLQ